MGASAMFPGVGVGSMPHLASATLCMQFVVV
jgi:hypothetical protein